MRTIVGYLKPYGGRIAVGVSVKFTAAVLELLVPFLLGVIIDERVPAGDVSGVWRTGGLMLLLAFAALGCNVTANYMGAWVSMKTTERLRQDLYSRIAALSCAQLDAFSSASLVSRLTNDTYNVHQMFDKFQRGGIRAPMLVLGGLALTFFIEPYLALVQLIACAATFAAIAAVTRRGVPCYGEAQRAVDTVVRLIRENASGVRVIKALNGQAGERGRFDAANRAARRAEERAGVTMAAANPLTDLLLNTGLVCVILVGAVLARQGRMTSGRIMGFLSYFTIVQTATLGLAKLFVKISKGAASARRIEEVLKAPDIQPLRPSEETGEDGLAMEDVSFSYLGVERDVEDVSFTLRPGETLGVFGPTGSGKSTLAALLLRLYDPARGVVRVGGKPTDAWEQAALRRRFGMVFQSEALLSGSIYDNIAFLRPISREDAYAAACTAQAAEFIDALPGGLDARVDIRGANLSGGQRQRLLIARALAGKPGILILDSADSALDYETAGRLRAALKRDCPEITLVVISERIASLRGADRILVLEDGRAAAQGTHAQLLQTSERYRRVAELQEGGGAL